MFSVKYYEYQKPVVHVVGLIFFNFNLWLWGHFDFYLEFGEPVWSCHDVLKIKKVLGKYKLQSLSCFKCYERVFVLLCS